MQSDPVALMKNVAFSYGADPILEDVSLEVMEREFVYLVGPNGGGKTTLLKLMLGLLKPVRGDVRIFGMPPGRAANRIGYVPQHMHFDPQFPVTVNDIVLMGRLGGRLGGPYSRADKSAAMDALGEVEMRDLAARPFSRLSGGQRQRVLIARALATRPELLLLDEPTANVDAVIEEKILQLIKVLNRRMTVVMVSHNLGFVIGDIEKVVCVNRRVVIHPTGEAAGESLGGDYGRKLRVILHDRSCEAGKEHGGGIHSSAS